MIGFSPGRSPHLKNGKSETSSVGELANRANKSARCVKIIVQTSFRKTISFALLKYRNNVRIRDVAHIYAIDIKLGNRRKLDMPAL